MDLEDFNDREERMLICDQMWQDEWFCSLPQRQKLLYIYLLCNSTKCGVFELNTRRMNFDLSNGSENIKPYTVDEVLSFAGHRIQKIGDSRAIIVNYIAVNWMRGKPLDPVKNPLHRGLAQELARYDLTFESLNEMAKKKVAVIPEEAQDAQEAAQDASRTLRAVKMDKHEGLFEEFWKAYPSACPRKVDKKKCHDKYIILMRDAKNCVALHKEIMEGLARWMTCDTWVRNNGQYIKAPLVWLNGNNWMDNPGGTRNEGNGNGGKRSDNAVRTGNSADIADLF